MPRDLSWPRPVWGAVPADMAASAAPANPAAPVASATGALQVVDREAFIQRRLPVLPPASEPNVVAMFRDRCTRFGDAPHWRIRHDDAWKSMSWSGSHAVVNELIAGLSALGVRPGTKVGILSETRWEWLAADWAILGLGAVTVPLYASLTAEMIAYMLNDAQVEAVFVENAEQYAKLASVRASLPSLKALILIEMSEEAGEDEAAGEDEDRSRGSLRIISFEALRRLSGQTPEQAEALARTFAADLKPDQMASVIYTSGTTNRPKGVIHTHASLMGQVRSTGAALTTFIPGTTHLLWLPLAHVLGREEHLVSVDRGGVTYIAESTETLARDIREAHPNIIVGVPRIYEKAYAAIEERAMGGGAAQRRIFQWAKGVGAAALDLRLQGKPIPPGLRLRSWLADRLVFRKVRAGLGGALDFSITGGAPIGMEILRFFHAAGVKLLEGWGLTETMGAITVNRIDNFRLGTVGPPTMDHEVRIEPDGEVLVRGPCLFSGYLNLPEENAAALDSEGWLHTGDLGEVDADGFLSISGRKKELIILASGKKIVPDPIETLLKTIPVVSHAMVYGDRKPYMVALLTLDPEAVTGWARHQGVAAPDAETVAASSAFVQYLANEVMRVNGQLARFETVKRYAIAPGDFTIENGLLTPTLKIKRGPLYVRFRDLIEGLYASA